MKTTAKITAAALVLGLAASPSLAQTYGSDSSSYNRDGTLNVWGAHIEPGSVLGLGGVVGGVTGAAGGVLGGTLGAADDIATGSIAPRRAPVARSGVVLDDAYAPGRRGPAY